jgi:hypothetical protein
MALVLFARWTLPTPAALLTLVASIMLSDCLLHVVYGHALWGNWSASNLLAYLLIFLFNKPSENITYRIRQTLVASVLFWIISNAGVWLTGSLYTLDYAGLLQCYTLAIPFLKNSLMGDLFWLSMLTLASLSLRPLCQNKLTAFQNKF